MFRLTTAPARHGRQLLAGLLPPAVHVPVPFVTTRRTMQYHMRPRPSPPPKETSKPPSPQAKKTSRPGPLPGNTSVPPRPLSDFQVRIGDPGGNHVSAHEARDIYTKYMEAMTAQDKPADWQDKFVRDTGFSAAKLHETATFVLTFSELHISEFELFCGLMNAAAGLGDDAAALSLGRILHHTDEKYYVYWDQPQWRHARERCQALIEGGRDANALVLKGLIHLARKTPKDNSLALEAFAQAERVGAEDAARFDWEASCLEGLGEAHLRLKAKGQAEEAFTRLADLDCARGFYRLAKMLPRSESSLDWLNKAAASGISEAYQLLVDEHERLRSICMSQGREEEARRHELDAAEWTLITRANKERP